MRVLSASFLPRYERLATEYGDSFVIVSPFPEPFVPYGTTLLPLGEDVLVAEVESEPRQERLVSGWTFCVVLFKDRTAIPVQMGEFYNRDQWEHNYRMEVTSV